MMMCLCITNKSQISIHFRLYSLIIVSESFEIKYQPKSVICSWPRWAILFLISVVCRILCLCISSKSQMSRHFKLYSFIIVSESFEIKYKPKSVICSWTGRALFFLISVALMFLCLCLDVYRCLEILSCTLLLQC